MFVFLGALGSRYSPDKITPIARELYQLYSNPNPYEVFQDALHFLQVVRGERTDGGLKVPPHSPPKKKNRGFKFRADPTTLLFFLLLPE